MSPDQKTSPDVEARLAAAEERTQAMRKLLRRVVREEDVTLRQLGRATGRSEDYWSKLLRGLRNLHVEHVYQALDVVGVEPETFFTRLHVGRSFATSPAATLEATEAAKLLGDAGEAAKVFLRLAALTAGREGEG
jgi:transcriptional regulator with XRE-family HTH domain